MQFADNVYDVLADLQRLYGFVPARAVAGKRFASLVKRATSDVLTYVCVHDGRAGDAELIVSLWVAPPDLPDDSLDSLGIGFKIRIGATWNVSDEFFARCQARIISLLPALDAVAAVVETDIREPKSDSQRLAAYQKEGAVYRVMTSIATEQPGSACARALQVSRRVAENKDTFANLESACVDAVNELVDGNMLDRSIVLFYQQDLTMVGKSATAQLYIHSLVALDA